MDADVMEVQPADLSSLEAMTRGEVDVQVATAKRYPRSVRRFLERAEEMACLNAEIAESCMYALPRGGKTIEGPSARFAELVANAWGHMRIEARPVDEGERFVSVRGTAWDLEANVAIAFEVKRRITTSRGARYDDDMIGVTTNAAGSIAIRNAVLKAIPKAFWGPIYNKARKVAVGDASTLASRRAAMLDYFMKLGAANDKVFGLLGVKGVEDITLEHLATLKGIATAIKEGDTTVDQAFSDDAVQGNGGEVRAGQRKSQQQAPPAAATETSTQAPAATTAPAPEILSVTGKIVNVEEVETAKNPFYRVSLDSGFLCSTWSKTLATQAREQLALGNQVELQYKPPQGKFKPELVAINVGAQPNGEQG